MSSDLQPRSWTLRLYVNGASPRSLAAITTVRRICDEELRDQDVDLTVIDVQGEPAGMREDHVVVVPTLVRRQPRPVRRVVSGLDDPERVRRVLEVGDRPEDGGPR